MRKAEEYKPEGLFRTSISCLFGTTSNVVLGLVVRELTKRFVQPSIRVTGGNYKNSVPDRVKSNEEHSS